MLSVDFICPHRPRDAASCVDSGRKTAEYRSWMKDFGRVVPILYQEPLRRGYLDWNPSLADMLADLDGAIKGGAAGWCFHNGPKKTRLL